MVLDTCCCNHGGRCSCASKKEPCLDTVPESDSDGESPIPTSSSSSRSKAPSKRRRANTSHSESSSCDPSSSSKATAKHSRNSSHRNSYSLNRVNSASSSTGSDSIEGRSRASSSARKVHSEAASPLVSHRSGFASLNGLPPLDLSRIDNQHFLNNGSMDMFGSSVNPDFDAPIYSAGIGATPVDWSHYDLSDAKRDSFSPSTSYSRGGNRSINGLFEYRNGSSGSDSLPQLANTTSTSGDVSEVEDFIPHIGGGNGEYDGYGGGAAYMRPGTVDYDNYYKAGDQGLMGGTGVSMVEEDPAFWMPNYNDGLTQESPDPMGPNAMGTFWDV